MMESVWNISTKMHDPGVDQRGGGEEEQQGEVLSAELHPGWGLTGGGARRHQLIYSPSPPPPPVSVLHTHSSSSP